MLIWAGVISLKKSLLNAPEYWYPIVLRLHRFMVAVARVSVNHDGRGGSASDPLVWDQGSRKKQRQVDVGVSVDHAAHPGPPGFFCRVLGFRFKGDAFLCADVAAWPYSVSLLCKFTFFLASLHWRAGADDMGFLPVLFEQWAGHRLLSEKVTRSHVRALRPSTISSVPASEEIVIRQGCRFIASLVRASGKLPGSIRRFLPCRIGCNMSRLRHLVWEQCSHGLTSRPLETCHHQCRRAVCGVLAYPSGTAAELLDGSVKLRYYTTQFSSRFLPLPYLHGSFLRSEVWLVRGRARLMLLLITWMMVVVLSKGSG